MEQKLNWKEELSQDVILKAWEYLILWMTLWVALAIAIVGVYV